MKKIALLVSIYNSGEWIESRLKNLLEATSNIDAEIICMNADSPDPLDHMIPLAYASMNDKFHYIKLPTRIGIYEAWNEAIKISNSEYLANANTDDLSGPLLYKTLCDYMDTNKNCGVSYCSWWSIGAAPKDWNSGQGGEPVNPGQFAGNFDRAQIGHFPVWRKSLHDQVGFFDGSLTALGDADFWAKVYFKTKYDFYWHRAPLASYRWRDGQNAWSRFISPEQWTIFHTNMARYKDGSNRN